MPETVGVLDSDSHREDLKKHPQECQIDTPRSRNMGAAGLSGRGFVPRRPDCALEPLICRTALLACFGQFWLIAVQNGQGMGRRWKAPGGYRWRCSLARPELPRHLLVSESVSGWHGHKMLRPITQQHGFDLILDVLAQSGNVGRRFCTDVSGVPL